MAFLLTPTLMNSVDWFINAPPKWKTDALFSLNNLLNRRWSSNKAVERGIAYEAMLYEDNLEKVFNSVTLTEKFKKAYDMIHADGHKYQKKVKKYITVRGNPYVLYGKTDVYFNNIIYDIKTTGNYKGRVKYLNTWQHKVYTYCSGIPKFKYIVYIFNKNGDLRDIRFIDYTVKDFKRLEDEIVKEAYKVINFLNVRVELRRAYITKFNLR